MFIRAILAILITASAIIPQVASAQAKPVKLESAVHLVRPAEGGTGTQLVEPHNVVPGDTLVFTTSFRNGGSSTVNDFVIVNPVPADLRLSHDTAAKTEVSVDGGHKWGTLADLKIIGSDGLEQPASVENITHMRWVFKEVPAGTAGEVQFSALVR